MGDPAGSLDGLPTVSDLGKYAGLFGTLPDGFVISDRRGRIVYANDRLAEMTGYRTDELVGRPIDTLVPERVRAGHRRRQQEYLLAPRVRSMGSGLDLRLRRRDGSELPVDISLGSLVADGEVLVAAAVRDATAGRETVAARQARERLREAETRYRSLVEHMPALTYVMGVGADAPITYIGPQVEALLGYTPDELVADPDLWVRILHPEDRGRVVESWHRANETRAPFTLRYRYIARDGRTVWVRDAGVLVRDEHGDPSYWQGVLVDETDRVEVEGEVRRRDAILKAVAFAARRLLAAETWTRPIEEILGRLGEAVGASRVYVFQNRTAPDGELLADQRFEWVGQGVEPQIDSPDMQGQPYDAAGFGDWARRMAAGEVVQEQIRDVSEEKRRILEPQGIRSLVLVPVAVGGAWWGFVGFDDCLEERSFSEVEIESLRAAASTLGAAIARERAVKALADAEERYRTLVEQLPAVTHISNLDEQASTIYMSPQVEAVLGYGPDEWLADDDLWEKLIHPDDRTRVMDANRTFIVTGEPFLQEYRMLSRDGELVWIREETVMVRDAKGHPRYAQGIMLDITDQKRAEDELRRSMELLRRTDAERRKLLGHVVRAQEEERARIAGDIHDDPLQKVAAVAMRLGTLRRQAGEELGSTLAELEDAAGRAVASLRHLLFDVRPPALDEYGLAAALKEYLGALRSETGIVADLVTELIDEPPRDARVICYRIAQEALSNVRKHAGASEVRVALRSRDGGVLTRIEDDGSGFDSGRSAGPGHLGLRTMRERAELAGGWLRVSTEPGRGTTVEFWVPSREPAE